MNGKIGGTGDEESFRRKVVVFAFVSSSLMAYSMSGAGLQIRKGERG